MSTFQLRMLSIFLTLCQLFLIISFLNSRVLAQENNTTSSGDLIEVTYESINPNPSYGYSFKRLKEKITLVLLSPFAGKKADYYMELLRIRLAEFKYVVDKKDIDSLQTTSERYFTTAGELTSFIIKNKLEDKKTNVVKLLEDHIKVTAKLEGAYSETTSQWRLIRYSSDYLKNYLAKLSGI